MGDNDDLSMDELLEQLRDLTGYEDKATPAQKSSSPNKQGSIIRSMEEALNNGALLDKRLIKNLKKAPAEPAKDTESGLKDLKKVRLEDLCEYIDSDVDIESTGGEYLIDLYHGYQMMIKRIIERHSGKPYQDPADYPEREIFDSISGIMEEDVVDELIFELTGEDEIPGGLESIANLVFDGLNNRFLENSGWASGDDIVTLIHRPGSIVSKPGGSITAFKDIREKSGKMNEPDIAIGVDNERATMDDIEEMLRQIRKSNP